MIVQSSNFSLTSTLKGKHIFFLILAFLIIFIIPLYGAESGTSTSSNLEEGDKLDSGDGITPYLSSTEPPSNDLNVLSQHVGAITSADDVHEINLELNVINEDHGDLYRGARVRVFGHLVGGGKEGWENEHVQLYVSHEGDTPWKDDNQFNYLTFDPLDYVGRPGVTVHSSTPTTGDGFYSITFDTSSSVTDPLSKPGKYNFFVYFSSLNPEVSGRISSTLNNGTFEMFGGVMIHNTFISGTLPQNEISVSFEYTYDNESLRDESGDFDVSLNYLWNETNNGVIELKNETVEETATLMLGNPTLLTVDFPARADIGSEVNTLHVIVTIKYSIMADDSDYLIAVFDQHQTNPEDFDKLEYSEESFIYNSIIFGVYWYSNVNESIIGNTTTRGYTPTVLSYRSSEPWLFINASSENADFDFNGRSFDIYVNRSETEYYSFSITLNKSGDNGRVNVSYDVSNILFENANFSVDDIRLPFGVYGTINTTEWGLRHDATKQTDNLRCIMIATISSFSAELTDRPNMYYYGTGMSSEDVSFSFEALDELNFNMWGARVKFTYLDMDNMAIPSTLSELTLSESMPFHDFSIPSAFNPDHPFFYVNFTILEEGIRGDPGTQFLYENATDSSVNGPISVKVFVYNSITLSLEDLDGAALDIPPSNNMWFNKSYLEAAAMPDQYYNITNVLGDHERNSTTLEGVRLAFVFYIGDTFEIAHEIVLDSTTIEDLLVWSPYIRYDNGSGGIEVFDNNLAHSDLSVRIHAYTHSGGLISDQLASITFSTYGPDTHSPEASDFSITPGNETIPHLFINITASLSDDDNEFTGVSRVVIVFNHTDATNSNFNITTLELTRANSSNFIDIGDDVNITININIVDVLSASSGDYVTVYLYIYDYAGYGHNILDNSRFKTAEYNASAGNMGTSEILSFRVGDYAPPVATSVVISQNDELIFPVPEVDENNAVIIPVSGRYGIISNIPVDFYIDVEDNIVFTGVEYASLSYAIRDSNDEVIEMNTVNLTLVNSDSFGLVWYYQFPGIGYLQDFSFEILSVDNSSSFNKGTTEFSVFLFGLDPLPPEIVEINWTLNAPVDSSDSSSFPTSGTEILANQTIDFTFLVKDDQSDVKAIEITINRYDENENIFETESVMLTESELVSGQRLFTYLAAPDDEEGVITYTITVIDLADNTISSAELSFAVVSIPIPIPNTESTVPTESNVGILVFLSVLIILFVGFIVAATVYLVYSARSGEEEKLPLSIKIEHHRLEMEKYIALEMYPEALALVPSIISEVAREKHSLQRKEGETILEFNEAILRTGAYRRHLLTSLMRGWQTLKYAEHKIDRELVDDVVGAVLNIEKQIKGNESTSI